MIQSLLIHANNYDVSWKVVWKTAQNQCCTHMLKQYPHALSWCHTAAFPHISYLCHPSQKLNSCCTVSQPLYMKVDQVCKRWKVSEDSNSETTFPKLKADIFFFFFADPSLSLHLYSYTTVVYREGVYT